MCPTLCDPIDGSPPGSPIPGILQARTLEWVVISFSNAGKWKVKVKSLSRVRLLGTPWTAAHQAPPSMGFSRQEYWSGVPLPSPLLSLMTTLFLFSLLQQFSFVFACSHVSDYTYSLVNVFPQTKGRQRTWESRAIGFCFNLIWHNLIHFQQTCLYPIRVLSVSTMFYNFFVLLHFPS